MSSANGPLQERGLAAMPALNGAVARRLFERNKDQHAFYVEEGFAVPWIYEYAVPHGLIFRLERERFPDLSAAVVERDRRYWERLSRELLANPAYRRDLLVQRTFAKLRANLGGLYAHRGLLPEAEQAFEQALQLCPSSAEASYRLAQLRATLGQFERARQVLEAYQRHDPYNAGIQQAILRLRNGRLPNSGP